MLNLRPQTRTQGLSSKKLCDLRKSLSLSGSPWPEEVGVRISRISLALSPF